MTDVVPGGETGHISTRNGVYFLKNRLSEDDYVIIHDAARPIVYQDIIDDLIEKQKPMEMPAVLSPVTKRLS